MARFRAFKRLARAKILTGFKKTKKVAKVTALAGAAGAFAGSSGSQPGLRREGAKEGAIVGIAVGASLIAAPKIGKIIFRRIRGRIIPIRVKK